MIITPAEAARRGWITAERPSLDLMGKEGAKKLLPLLGRLGSLYNKGAQSVIDYLELVDLCLPGGGLLTLRLEEVPPESMKTLDELFEVLDGLIDKEESVQDLSLIHILSCLPWPVLRTLLTNRRSA